MNPWEIRFTHDSISCTFRNGNDILEVAEALSRGFIDVHDFPPITVGFHRGKWWSADNRRLWVFREAGLNSVPVIVDHDHPEFHRNFKLIQDGNDVRVRGF